MTLDNLLEAAKYTAFVFGVLGLAWLIVAGSSTSPVREEDE